MKPSLKSDINVTPLVDVVLVLLIVFMIVTPLLERGYDARIVPMSGQSRPDRPDTILVSLTSRNEIYLNKEKVDRASLALQLREVLRANGTQVVFFSAEDGIDYSEAMQVIDTMRSSGARNIGIVLDWVNPF